MTSGIHICDAWVYVHCYRDAILYENLLQQHACDLASFNVTVRNEESIWPV